MQLFSGPAAIRALETLQPSGLLAVEIDPQARLGQNVEVVALGNSKGFVVFDARRTPEFGPWLRQVPVLAAFDAKQVQRSLLRTYGCGPGRWACVRICQQLLSAGRDVPLGLVEICAQLGLPPPPRLDGGVTFMGQHTQSLAVLVTQQAAAIKKASLQVISKIEAACVMPIARMEHHGMPFHAPTWETLAKDATQERAALRQQILVTLAAAPQKTGQASMFHGAVNLDNDRDLLAALQSRGYRLDNVRRRTVEKLQKPLGPWLARYRVLTKLTSSYGTAFLDHVDSRTGRLHPTFEQIGASTGRMACHAPNLQAVVKGTAHRGCFRAAADRRLVIADYRACELRILAEMSGDPVFLKAFAHNEDLHAKVAQSIFGKPVSEGQNQQLRQLAKSISFGLAYGMGAAGLARTIGASVPVAQNLLERYFATFPRIRTFLQQAALEAMARGWTQTLGGRRLDLTVLPYAADRSMAERVAKNMPIQGTNADIIKIALARVDGALQSVNGAKVVNCVHDEIVVECPAAAAEGVSQLLTQHMVQAGAELLTTVKLAVQVEVAQAWN